MKDIFSPIFFTSLISLVLFHHLNVYHEIFYPVIHLVFVLALILFVLKKLKLSYVCISLSLVLLLTAFFLEQKSDFQIQTERFISENQYISVEGTLLDYPEIKKDHSIIYLKSDSLQFQQKKVLRTFNFRIKVKGNLQRLFRGDEISIQAKISKNTFNRNFYPSPFENLVLYRQIHFNGYSKSDFLVRVIGKTHLGWRIIGEWRNRIRGVIENKLMEKDGYLDRSGVFLQANLLGDLGKMDVEQKEELLCSGIFHLYAISGAHIGIIAILSMLFLKIVGFKSRQRIIVTMLLLMVFLALSGFKISAQRAVLMAILIFGARMFHYDIHIFGIISFSGLIMLFKNPATFLDPGFILTYMITLAIIVGREIFIRFLKPLPAYIRELISANLSASLISLPLSLFFFKRYSFAGFFAGLVLFPLTAVIIGLGLAMLLVVPFSAGVAKIFLGINLIPLNWFFRVVDFFSESINLNVFRASPSIFWVFFILILFFLMRFENRFRFQKGLLTFFFIISLLAVLFRLNFYKPSNLELYYFDVGQGDSALVMFPEGKSLLIDGGGTYFSDYEVGKNQVLPFLIQKGIKVTWVAISHYHPDHVRGIIEVINVIHPEEIWISSEASKDFYFRKLLASLNGSIQVKKIHAPFTKIVGNCEIQFIFPREFIVAEYTHNNHSQVLRISDRRNVFLFTGDIERKVESFLAQTDCRRLRSRVLKVPHHGSKTSSSEFFLECVKPEVAVISLGKQNQFEFPHSQVLERLKCRKIKWISTAIHGGIKIVSSPKGLRFEVSR